MSGGLQSVREKKQIAGVTLLKTEVFFVLLGGLERQQSDEPTRRLLQKKKRWFRRYLEVGAKEGVNLAHLHVSLIPSGFTPNGRECSSKRGGPFVGRTCL